MPAEHTADKTTFSLSNQPAHKAALAPANCTANKPTNNATNFPAK